MNPQKKLKNLRGQEFPKSFPLQEELDKLPKIKDQNGKDVPDINKLEKETVGNVILNCLANYIVGDKKEGFYINLIAQSLLSDNKKIEFKDKIKRFLIEVLDELTARKVMEKDDKGVEKEKIEGVYSAWLIAQIKEELGEGEELKTEEENKKEE